jgi:hypothetical protein
VLTTSAPAKQGTKVTFSLPSWEESNPEKTKWYRRKRKKMEKEERLKKGVLDGSIPSTVSDSGATSSVGKVGDTYIQTTERSNKTFHVPTGTTATATNIAKLVHKVREPARTIDMVPAIKHNSLLSTSKFAEADYITVYDKDEVNIYDATTTKIVISEEAVLKGWRDPTDGLWRIPLVTNLENLNTDTLLFDGPGGHTPVDAKYDVASTDTTKERIAELTGKHRPHHSEAVNNVYELPSIEQSIRYLHAAAGFPTKETWLAGIRKGNYSSWPMVNTRTVGKYFPESDETQEGHMRQRREGVRSTKKRHPPTSDVPVVPLRKESDVMIHVYDLKETVYTDQTGRFPFCSSKGNRYIMVLCEMDGNVILSEAMKNRTEGEMIKTHRILLQRLKACGIKPKHQILDNEVSAAYKLEIQNNGMTYQLVPPNNHRRNIAEKAIQTFKDHFVAILSGVDNSFPMHLWDRLLPQAEHTLLLLRQANVAPKVSAYAYMYGHHDYNAMPLAPMGCAVKMHEKPSARKTWSKHTVDGWYIGTSREHYRCFNIWTKETRTTRVSDTVFFKHKYLTNPSVTPADALIAAAQHMTAALRSNLPTSMGEGALEALQKLENIFANAATKHKEDQHLSLEGNNIRRPTPRVQVVPPTLRVPEGTPAPRVPEAAADPRVHTATIRAPVSPAQRVRPASEHTDAPAYNTRARAGAQTRSIAQSFLLSCVENPDSRFAPRKLDRHHGRLPKWYEHAGAILDDETGEMLEYRHLIKRPKYKAIWHNSFGNEIGRLAQGMPGRVQGTNTIFFIDKKDVPQDRWKDVTYGRMVCDYRPEKDDPYRTRLTVGGDKINYPHDCGTPTADLLTIKLLLNSVVSTPGARFMTIDIKNFYLNTPMLRYEYMRLKLSDLPEDVIDFYGLRDKVTQDGYVYVEVRKGMYGLPQAGLLAQELLETRLIKHGYYQSKMTPGLWKHKWRPIQFPLVVDDFGVEYVGKEHADHLVKVLEEHYAISQDWEGKKYCGLTLDWDYEGHQVHLSLPGYIKRALIRFRHAQPKKRQDQPHQHVRPTYGAKAQYAEEGDSSEPLTKQEQKFVQEVVGVFLYLARAIDVTMLPALGSIATTQAAPTANTMNKVKQFLDYAASQEDAVLTYRASGMVLAIHSDASYLSETGARSRAGGHMFMSENDTFPKNNGAVLSVAQIIKAVMSSAAEAELGGLYINAREAVPARITLEEMGWPQPPTPVQTDNTMAHGVVTNKIQPRRTKAMDMRFHWLRDRENQKQFRFYWRPGAMNLGDYPTKHHAAAHHKNVRPEYLTPMANVIALRQKKAIENGQAA